MNARDLSNVAYTNEYQSKREEAISAIIRPENLTDTEYILSKSRYNRTIINYSAKLHGYNLTYSHNKVYDTDENLVYEYISEYGHPFFCTLISHSNGRQYLAYKENLYGYSVFDIRSNETFKYIPATSWKGGETFIATDIYYNSANDMVVAEGCYWACPYGVFLFEVKEPMKLFTRYLDIQMLLGGYDKYEDIEFQGWKAQILCLNVIILSKSRTTSK